tara:strand:- start:1735 stop:2724 length:990 start_codon:yes stop_codon:yes gene_type:complete
MAFLQSNAQDPTRRSSIGISQVLMDNNVVLPEAKLFPFDSSLSHFIRFAYQHRLSRSWMLNTGVTNGFIQNSVIQEKFVTEAFVLGIDASLMLKLNNGKLMKENPLVAPFLSFGYRADYIPLLEEQEVSPWVAQNQYGAGFNIRLTPRRHLQIQVAIDQELKGDFNTALQYRFGLTQSLGGSNNSEFEEILVNRITELEEELDSVSRIVRQPRTSVDTVFIVKSEDSTDVISIVEPIDKEYFYTENYYVVVESLRNFSKAKDQLIVVQEKFEDYCVRDVDCITNQVRVLPQSSGTSRIAIYAGKNRGDAENLRERVKELGYQTAWISFE